MLIEPLERSTPAAFNGGLVVRPDVPVIEQRVTAKDVPPPVIELLGTPGDERMGPSGRGAQHRHG